MIDYLFLMLISMCLVFTPIHSEYKQINAILTAKFCLFIGMHNITVSMGAHDGAWVDFYRLGLDLSFSLLFFYYKGIYLGFLCVLMAVFHLFNTMIPYDYAAIMIGFQVLQLCAATWGMLDGFNNRSWAYFNRRTSD